MCTGKLFLELAANLEISGSKKNPDQKNNVPPVLKKIWIPGSKQNSCFFFFDFFFFFFWKIIFLIFKNTVFHQKLLFFEEIWQNGGHSEYIWNICHQNHFFNFLYDFFFAMFITFWNLTKFFNIFFQSFSGSKTKYCAPVLKKNIVPVLKKSGSKKKLPVVWW